MCLTDGAGCSQSAGRGSRDLTLALDLPVVIRRVLVQSQALRLYCGNEATEL